MSIKLESILDKVNLLTVLFIIPLGTVQFHNIERVIVHESEYFNSKHISMRRQPILISDVSEFLQQMTSLSKLTSLFPPVLLHYNVPTLFYVVLACHLQ